MLRNRIESFSLVVGVLISLMLSHWAFAETRTFVKEYTYLASDIDSKVSSRAIALEQVKRSLLEQLGTYLISETEVRNFQMTKDQITTLTAGIVSAEVIEETWDGKSYYLKAKIAADPKEVARSVDALRNDVQKNKELEESKNKAESAMREVERLRKELATLKAGGRLQTKQQKRYDTAINSLSAKDWYDRGRAFEQLENFQKAIEAFSQAIGLDPLFQMAYAHRGYNHEKSGNHREAITDYTKSLQLKTLHAHVYSLRGYAYSQMGEYKKALTDYAKAISINDKDLPLDFTYLEQGRTYFYMGNMDSAIESWNNGLSKFPSHPGMLNNLAIAYVNKKRYDDAAHAAKAALAADPHMPDALNSLGQVCMERSEFSKATDYFLQAIELEPNKPSFYWNEALALDKESRVAEALEYARKYREMEPDSARQQQAEELIQALTAKLEQ